jgi:putative ABC transport system permease protein
MKNPIFDIENWREIGATLARNKTRTFLTAFGIFWGTAMLAMLWGGAGGLKGMLMRNFNGTDTNMGVIFPGRTTLPYKGFNKGMTVRKRSSRHMLSEREYSLSGAFFFV